MSERPIIVIQPEPHPDGVMLLLLGIVIGAGGMLVYGWVWKALVALTGLVAGLL